MHAIPSYDVSSPPCIKDYLLPRSHSRRADHPHGKMQPVLTLSALHGQPPVILLDVCISSLKILKPWRSL